MSSGCPPAGVGWPICVSAGLPICRRCPNWKPRAGKSADPCTRWCSRADRLTYSLFGHSELRGDGGVAEIVAVAKLENGSGPAPEPVQASREPLIPNAAIDALIIRNVERQITFVEVNLSLIALKLSSSASNNHRSQVTGNHLGVADVVYVMIQKINQHIGDQRLSVVG